MWLQFFLENTHFALNLFVTLVFFAVFWLYFDAWTERKMPRETPKILGFLLLSISFVIHATSFETSVITTSIFTNNLTEVLVSLTRIPGYILIIFGLILDPLQPQPKIKNVPLPIAFALPPTLISFFYPLPIFFPILASAIAFLYLRRATIGLENHLKKVALSFLILSISELLALGYLLRGTANIEVFKLVAPFGPLWAVQHLVLVAGVLLLGKWVSAYLFKRLQTQLFMIFTSTVLGIFLLTTVTFTGLLLKNLQDETLQKLETDVKVLNFAIESKKAENLSDAQVVAQNPSVISAISEGSKSQLNDITQKFLLTKKESSLIIVGDSGQVLARGEDRNRKGDSLSADPLVKNALLGKTAFSAVSADGPLAPIVSLRSASPIKDGDKIVGAVITGSDIDNAFVDGIKNATGLATSIYGDNILSATSLTGAGGKSRPIGIKEENSPVKTAVLTNGQSYTGTVEILNTPYFASYLPIKDIDNTPVGMLFVGRAQVGVLEAAGRSIELTFITTVILLALSIIPAFLISKFISGQVR